ncbi:MAG: hypothetical protein JNM84_04280 [Planctomycetes bacterium]|nr:hypothetical protein [Planctomycetota bacterium]
MPRFPMVAAALAIGLCSAESSAQRLTSRSLDVANGRLLVSFAIEAAPPQTQFTLAIGGGNRITSTAPTLVVTDARGFARAVVNFGSSVAQCPPESFLVSFTAGSTVLTRELLLQCTAGRVHSAFPDYVQLAGAFCNPAASASNHLQIQRSLDLDGDGRYGDLEIEGVAGTPDRLDFPNEVEQDVNACAAGPGVYQPGSVTRAVAWATDNRVVNTCSGSCNFTTQTNFLQDMAFVPSFPGGGPALFSTSDSFDTVIVLRDANNDGRIGNAEFVTYFDPKALVNNENYSPDGVAVDPSGLNRSFWITDKTGTTASQTNVGLYRLVDLNADGVIGAGEFTASWTGTSGVVVVETQNVDHSEFEGVHCDSTGAVYLNSSSAGTIFRWVDANSDGVAQTGEVTNWLTYNTTSALSVSADFNNPVLNFPLFTGFRFSMNLIESIGGLGTAGRELVFVGTDEITAATRGSIFRCDDINGDGDVNDAGEVVLFVRGNQVNDPLGAPPVNQSGLDVIGIDFDGNGSVTNREVCVYVASPNGGPIPTTGFTFVDLANWRYRDIDGDGTALTTADEAVRVAIDPTGHFNRGLELVSRAELGGFRPNFYSRSGLVTVTPASCTSSNGQYLTIDFSREKNEDGTQGTPFYGNQRFEFLVEGCLAGQGPVAGLFIGPVLPFQVPIPPCTLGVDISNFITLPLGGGLATPDANGLAEIAFGIPNLALLEGLAIGVQSFQVDVTTLTLILGEVAEVRVF